MRWYAQRRGRVGETNQAREIATEGWMNWRKPERDDWYLRCESNLSLTISLHDYVGMRRNRTSPRAGSRKEKPTV